MTAWRDLHPWDRDALRLILGSCCAAVALWRLARSLDP